MPTPANKPGMNLKVYLVCQFLNLVQPGQPNVAILGAKLTRASAQGIVDSNPGTFIRKLQATK